MENILFKDLTSGSVIYALIKKDNELEYVEGSIVSIGQQRAEMTGQSPVFGMKTVVDVTYCLNGKNYTDAVSITDGMFSTLNLGAITLVATSKDPVIRELHATRKKSQDYIKATETELPRNKKRIEDCDKLIKELDTEYAEKQDMERRLTQLEERTSKANDLLTQILNKLG